MSVNTDIASLLADLSIENGSFNGDPTVRRIACTCGADGARIMRADGFVYITCPTCAPTARPLTLRQFRRLFAPNRRQGAFLDRIPDATAVGTFADLEASIGPIRYDWPGWLAQAFFTLVVAASGVGKSLLLLRIALCYLLGLPWPDGTPFSGEVGKVVWAETEGAQGLNLQRAKAWGAPLASFLTPFPDPLESVILENPDHRAQVQAIAEREDVRAVFVDSLSGGSAAPENKGEMLRSVLWLAELARDTGKPVLCSHHLRKARENERDPKWAVTLDAVRGHSSIVQPARLVWALDLPGGPGCDVRRLSMLKHSMGALAEPFGMVINPDGGLTFGPAPDEPDTTALGIAKRFLLGWLDREPQEAGATEEEAEGRGISRASLRRAKDVLGVVSIKRGAAWYWGLPAPQGVEE